MEMFRLVQTAHNVVEGTTRSGGQEHFYLETNATIAIPKTENEEMELITTSQAIVKLKCLLLRH